MKKILIFTFSPDDWSVYRKILEPFFKETDIEICTASLQTLDPLPKGIIAALVSYNELAGYLDNYLPLGTPILWINHTLDKPTFAQIQDICRTNRISVASDTLYYSESRCRMLENLGIPRQSLNIWYPGIIEEELEKNIIVFENCIQNPPADSHLIFINNRGMIGADTLMELFGAIGRLDLLNSPRFREYLDGICFNVRQSNDLLDIGDYYMEIRGRSAKSGFLMFSGKDRTINYCDSNAGVLLRKSVSQIYGKSIYELFPFMIPHQEEIELSDNGILLYDGKRLVFDVWSYKTHGSYNGNILIMDDDAEVKKELQLRRLKTARRHQAKYTFRQIIGNSKAITRCKEIARTMAHSDANVLIVGPSGTGKELFAQAIHNASSRRKNPFISVNCGALVESLLESELFGYEGGAFTGARKEGKAGFFELAHKGTLFLDEVGEMPLSLQVKLLRVLQEREVVRVGGCEAIPIDVRIIAATNADLKAMVHDGKFRLDMYYRLNVLPLHLPSLNDRREDILPLFTAICRERGFDFQICQDAATIIQNHDYEGNVRELQNCVEYLGSLGKSEITVEDLPPYITEAQGLLSIQQNSLAMSTNERSEAAWVLWAISELHRSGTPAGRRSITAFLKDHMQEPISEMRVREILKELSNQGHIQIQKGRNGIILVHY